MATPSKPEQMPPEPMPNTIKRRLAVRPRQADKHRSSQPGGAEEADKVVSPKNVTTASSVDKHGSSQPRGAEETAKVFSPNNGATANGNSVNHSHCNFNGEANGGFINNLNKYGAHSGDRNRYHTANNYGGRTVNNSGTFNGHGNGGFIDGNFDASTRNYY